MDFKELSIINEEEKQIFKSVNYFDCLCKFTIIIVQSWLKITIFLDLKA